jgi:hypothetical protein
MKEGLSKKRLILSAIAGIIWASLGSVFIFAVGISNVSINPVFYILFLPTFLALLIGVVIQELLGLTASAGYTFFGLALPFIFSTAIVYSIAGLIVRKGKKAK